MKKNGFFFFVAVAFGVQPLLADVAFRSSDQFLVSGESFWVDIYCSSHTQDWVNMGSEYCENDWVKPAEYDRLIGPQDPRAERIKLWLIEDWGHGDETYVGEFRYDGKSGQSEHLKMSRVLNHGYYEGDLVVRFQILGKKKAKGRPVLEEGRFEILVEVERESGWSRTYHYWEHDRCTFRPSTDRVCHANGSWPHYPAL